MAQLHPNRGQIEQLPTSFAKAVEIVKNFALLEFKKEVAQKQLYYHNCEHIKDVQQRAKQIFQAIRPYWEESLDKETSQEYLFRMELLLDLCAISHDLVQEFVPQTQPYTSRKRESGLSETATIEKLIDYIKNLNRQLIAQDSNSPAVFTNSDIQIITEAIAATICLYDPSDGSLYQPDLYKPNTNLSLVAQIIALADIGSLGMEGIEKYKQEGSLLFLEENPDVILWLLNNDLAQNKANYNFSCTFPQKFRENLRQRLLKRARFQVSFARGRVARFTSETAGFPSKLLTILPQIFKYLNQETLEKIELTTPSAEDTTLEELIEFFEFQKYIYIANG